MRLKKYFLRSKVPRRGGRLDRPVGQVGLPSLVWEKIYKKKFFLIEQVTIQKQKDYVKHQYLPTFKIPHIISLVKTSRAQHRRKN